MTTPHQSPDAPEEIGTQARDTTEGAAAGGAHTPPLDGTPWSGGRRKATAA